MEFPLLPKFKLEELFYTIVDSLIGLSRHKKELH